MLGDTINSEVYVECVPSKSGVGKSVIVVFFSPTYLRLYNPIVFDYFCKPINRSLRVMDSDNLFDHNILFEGLSFVVVFRCFI